MVVSNFRPSISSASGRLPKVDLRTSFPRMEFSARCVKRLPSSTEDLVNHADFQSLSYKNRVAPYPVEVRKFHLTS